VDIWTDLYSLNDWVKYEAFVNIESVETENSLPIWIITEFPKPRSILPAHVYIMGTVMKLSECNASKADNS
jgi:hypothetical protein